MGKKPIEPGAQAPADVPADVAVEAPAAAPPLPATGGMYHFIGGELVPQGYAPTVQSVLTTMGEKNEI